MNQMLLHTLFYVHSLACSRESGWMHHYYVLYLQLPGFLIMLSLFLAALGAADVGYSGEMVPNCGCG